MKILLVEDDQNFAKFLQIGLKQWYYQVDIAVNGHEGWELAMTFPYDLILLDWMLSNLDGLSFCERLRARNQPSVHLPNQKTPLLLMTAFDAANKRIVGLDAGADDYIVKPLDLNELHARILALTRRSRGQASQVLTWGEIQLDQKRCQVTFAGRPIALRLKEYQLLELFLRHPDQIFSQSRLMDLLWGVHEHPTENAVRAQIKGLRRKLKQAGAGNVIATVYKLGYRLEQQTPKPAEPPRPVAALPAALPDTISSEIVAVWETARDSYLERLAVIETAAAALITDQLTPQLGQQAEREAHTLAGSLGSFGFEQAFKLARQIQPFFQTQKQLSPSEAERLNRLLRLLRQVMLMAPTVIPESTVVPFSAVSTLPSSFTLMIVDDDAILANQFAATAKVWGMQTAIATSIPQARDVLSQQIPDVILLDLKFPTAPDDGLDFLAELKQTFPNLPVLVFTSSNEILDRVQVARLGGKSFLQKPITSAQLLTEIIQIYQQSYPTPARIMVASEDLEILQRTEYLLASDQYQIISLQEAHQFWPTLERVAPDLLVLDAEFSGALDTAKAPMKLQLNSLDFCQMIRNDPQWNPLPILLLSDTHDWQRVQQGFVAGADDYLDKTNLQDELLIRVQKRLEQGRLNLLHEIDPLTGLGNRRKVIQELIWLLRLAHRQQQSFSLAMLDLDHFKAINDLYGNEMGDAVLNCLGKLLIESFRREDVIGRWGGEEFVVGMYGTTKADGMRRLQEVLRIWADKAFITPDGQVFQVTFSAGIAQLGEDGVDVEALQRTANERLYQAKRGQFPSVGH